MDMIDCYLADCTQEPVNIAYFLKALIKAAKTAFSSLEICTSTLTTLCSFCFD
ncbi:hypothetical protein DOY81_006151 [Sarcophaga bullata]|nr:hypothetical protein DOY81_006151 [Sarcophaga bullata]